MVSGSAATRESCFHMPGVESGVSALPNDQRCYIKIVEYTFMLGLVPISESGV